MHGCLELDIRDVWRVWKSASNFLCTEVYYILHSTQKPPPYRENTQRQQLSLVVLVCYGSLPLEVCRVVPQSQGLEQRPKLPVQGKTLPQVPWISVGIPHKEIWRHLNDAGSHEGVGAVGFFPELRVSSCTQIPFVHACI